MAPQAFEDFADAYEAMVDWPRRLAHEEPFYRGLIRDLGAKRVLDAACGTGHHAALFYEWGLSVEGADLSPAMIQRCHARLSESQRLRWVVRGFDQPVDAPGSFDLAICVGNSLALAPSTEVVERALRQMLAAVRPGGALVVQVLNLWRLSDGPCLWQKCRRTRLPAGESLIVKGVHRSGPRGYVDLLVTLLESDPPTLRSDSVAFLGLEAQALSQLARAAGASQVQLYGGYDRQSYEPEKSADLILVALS